jgi:hypothetical protein
MRVIFSVRTAPPGAMRDKHTGCRISWRNCNHQAAFSQCVCSGHRSAPPLRKKLFWTTDNIVPATASSGKTVPASPPFFLVVQQGELTLELHALFPTAPGYLNLAASRVKNAETKKGPLTRRIAIRSDSGEGRTNSIGNITAGTPQAPRRRGANFQGVAYGVLQQRASLLLRQGHFVSE